MAGAAVIVAVTNALGDREFPFVFGGDGASFAVPAADAARRAQALAETATWVQEDLDLTLADRHGAGRRHSRAGPRRPRRPLRAVGEHLDRDVLRRRHGLGRRRHEARRDRGRRRRRPARIPTSPACRAATRKSRRRAGWCCRWWSRRRRAPAGRLPRRDRAHRPDRREDPRRVAAGAGPAAAPDLAAAGRRPRSARFAPAGESLWQRKIKVLAWTLFAFLVMRFGITVGRFIPAKYTRELVDNSDFRKFDDSLRMVLDCTPELADEIEQHLAGLRREGHRALRHAPPARRDDDVLHAVADQLQPRAFHRRRDGRLRDGGERAEGRLTARGLDVMPGLVPAFTPVVAKRKAWMAGQARP